MATKEQEAYSRMLRDPRRQWGWGPSDLAAQEERAAYETYVKMPLVESGEISAEDLPEEYGGRPRGTSRRAMRMQFEYDKMKQEQLQNQRLMQEMELARDREARFQRDQDFQFAEAETRAEREGKIQDEAGLMIDAMRGAVDASGNVIANPIRPEDPNAIERLTNLAKEFKLGIENKAAASMFNMLLTDAMKFREERMKESDQNELAAVNLSVRTGRPFEELGTYDELGMFQPNPQGIISASEEVKMAEEAKQEERAIAREGRGEEARVRAREESDKRTRRRQIDDDILTEEQILIDYQNQKQSPSRDAEIKKSRAKLLNLSIKRAAVDDLVFKDQDAYKKALEEGRKIPSGTTIYIGTIPVKVK